MINKIVGFNAHITVKPYDKKYINPSKFNIPQLNSISKNLISSNSGEAIIIQKDVSKGIVLRGYYQNDFSKLKIIKDETFIGDRNNLTKNYISLGKELSFALGLKIGDDITIMSSSGIETIIGSLPKKKILTIDLFKTPIDFKIAISRVLFLTKIVKPEIMLKAATIIIKDNIMNITFLSTLSAENRELFVSAQL